MNKKYQNSQRWMSEIKFFIDYVFIKNLIFKYYL